MIQSAPILQVDCRCDVVFSANKINIARTVYFGHFGKKRCGVTVVAGPGYINLQKTPIISSEFISTSLNIQVWQHTYLFWLLFCLNVLSQPKTLLSLYADSLSLWFCVLWLVIGMDIRYCQIFQPNIPPTLKSLLYVWNAEAVILLPLFYLHFSYNLKWNGP